MAILKGVIDKKLQIHQNENVCVTSKSCLFVRYHFLKYLWHFRFCDGQLLFVEFWSIIFKTKLVTDSNITKKTCFFIYYLLIIFSVWIYVDFYSLIRLPEIFWCAFLSSIVVSVIIPNFVVISSGYHQNPLRIFNWKLFIWSSDFHFLPI